MNPQFCVYVCDNKSKICVIYLKQVLFMDSCFDKSHRNEDGLLCLRCYDFMHISKSKWMSGWKRMLATANAPSISTWQMARSTLG